MSVKAMSLVLAFVGDEPMNVAQVCREVGISRKSFYKYVDRVRVEGVAGFEPRSRRPHVASCDVGGGRGRDRGAP